MCDADDGGTKVPRELLEKAEKARSTLLPTKSEPAYKKEYDRFQQWLKENCVNYVDETILLAYFQDMVRFYISCLVIIDSSVMFLQSKVYSANSLWTKWSMLKTMMIMHHKIKAAKFQELEAFLKRKSKGYQPKKSEVFTQNDVVKFLKEAPNEVYLLHKVVLFRVRRYIA